MKNIWLNNFALPFLLLCLLCNACNYEMSNLHPYQPPELTNDGIEVGTLDQVSIDTEMIAKATGRIHQEKYKEVHSMLIYKDGMLVFEEYYTGHAYQWDAPKHHGELVAWEKDMLHDVHSVTKSITSACIGIAIDKGFIHNIHQSIFDYLPDHQQFKKDGKENITIEHLASMTSGLDFQEWNAPYSSPENDIIGVWFSEKDPLTFFLDRPLKNTPGTTFNYSGGDIILLSEILRTASGMAIDEFSTTYLFEPMGIDTSNWTIQYPNGVFEAAGSLQLTPRAMVKFGATFLNGGIWNGNRIISQEWVDKSSVPFGNNTGINVPGEPSGKLGYAYTWWTKTHKHSTGDIHMYSASGWGGQHIMVLPEVNTVVVFTGGNYTTKRPPFEVLERFILPGIK